MASIDGLSPTIQTMACVPSTIGFKNGLELCDIYSATWFILRYSTVSAGYADWQLTLLAEGAVKQRSPSFELARDCSFFFEPDFDLDVYTMIFLGKHGLFDLIPQDR